MKVIPETRRTH